MSKQFDVVVIGGGPGGYIAAIRAAQLGFQVACVDEWKNAAGGPAPGGTCTNVGCIPSKALLQSSEHFRACQSPLCRTRHSAPQVSSMDVAKMIARKDNVVKQNNDGILYLFKKNKVTSSMVAAALRPRPLMVATRSRSTGAAEESLLASTSLSPQAPTHAPCPVCPLTKSMCCPMTALCALARCPRKLVLIGSGVIGLEMGSVWRRLGAEVTILEGLPTFLGAVDEQIAKEAKKAFDKQGLKIELGVKVGEINNGKKGVTVAYTNAKGEALTLDADKLIVSIGRVPNTTGLNAEAVGLQLDERGAICGGR
jgi:dihydrolipoamide dehydrogenase